MNGSGGQKNWVAEDPPRHDTMEEAKQLHARALRRGERRLQPLLLRVLDAGDLRYAALLLESFPFASRPSAPLHTRLLHALAAHRHPLLLPFFSRVHGLRLLTPLSFTLLFSSFATAAPSSPMKVAVSAHALLVKSGHLASGGDPFLASALVSFYAKNRLLDEARRAFEEIPRCSRHTQRAAMWVLRRNCSRKCLKETWFLGLRWCPVTLRKGGMRRQ
jgi:hypothetical protein